MPHQMRRSTMRIWRKHIMKYDMGMSQLELEDAVQDDLKRATGEFTKDVDDANKLNRILQLIGFTKDVDDANKLNCILQLIGFNDPVYAEAYVTVHHYDIVLDVTVINRTKDTLQNLYLELATMGDLKLVEHPQNYTLAPESSKQIRANIKVSSTETWVIFGNIVYETSNVLERTVVVLNDIHIDIMDYISPATCADAALRNMWAEFEWENKVAVNFIMHSVDQMTTRTPAEAAEINKQNAEADYGYFILERSLKAFFGVYDGHGGR